MKIGAIVLAICFVCACIAWNVSGNKNFESANKNTPLSELIDQRNK